MVRRKSAAIAIAVLALLATAWAFVVVIWIPLYGTPQGPSDPAHPEDSALQAEIVKEDGGSSRTWTVADAQALQKLNAELRRADFSAQSVPRSDQSYKLRIRRPDSKIDEYEVLLDERGTSPDMVYVVRRTGGTSIYGVAQKTPELKSALDRILKGSPPPK